MHIWGQALWFWEHNRTSNSWDTNVRTLISETPVHQKISMHSMDWICFITSVLVVYLVLPWVGIVFHGMGLPGKSLSLEQKILIIARHKYTRTSHRAIAHEVGTTERAVARWIKRFQSTKSLDRKAGQGCKQALGHVARNRAFFLLINDHQGARSAAKKLHAEGLTGKVVSGATLIKHAKLHAKKNVGKSISSRHAKPKGDWAPHQCAPMPHC